MVRISNSPAAFDAIAATLPLGSIGHRVNGFWDLGGVGFIVTPAGFDAITGVLKI
jgi:hypothetical protein